ncbi:MAG: hypothetical protein L3J96_01920 [Thermoplasmata archaeon]|nr:hypothetical protein [Thermoplasmata archaeon]
MGWSNDFSCERFIGPAIDLPPGSVSETADLIAAGFTAEGYALSGRSLPGVPSARQWSRRPAASGILVAERDLAPDTRYDRMTWWVSGGLALVWMAVVLATVALERGYWIGAVFIGALAFAVPAFTINSYRGRGYTGLVLMAELSSLAPLGPAWDGTTPELPLRIRLGGARVTSRRPVGRNLNGRWIRSVEPSPVAAAAVSALYQRLRSGAGT